MITERLFLSLPARSAPVRSDGPDRLLATAVAALRTSAAAIRRELSRRRTQALLMDLTDRELADIGLTRSDVHGYGLDGRSAEPRRRAAPRASAEG